MKSISVIIPTFNRIEELLITLPQIFDRMDAKSELLVFDQSTNYDPRDYIEEFKVILGNRNISLRIFHCKVASVTLAWNSAACLAMGDILLFLDDDIDLDFDILNAHRSKYEESDEIVGVAGSYFASSYDREWIPSSKGGRATTLAGVNASFLNEIFQESGTASSFIRPFAPFDWEMAEYVNRNYGRLTVGENIKVFHRAPANGGCENQAERGIEWYFGNYRNHFLWMFYRDFPYNLARLPRHFYWLLKYCFPKKSIRSKKKFWSRTLLAGFKSARQTYIQDGRKRASKKIDPFDMTMIYDSGYRFSKHPVQR